MDLNLNTINQLEDLIGIQSPIIKPTSLFSSSFLIRIYLNNCSKLRDIKVD